MRPPRPLGRHLALAGALVMLARLTSLAWLAHCKDADELAWHLKDADEVLLGRPTCLEWIPPCPLWPTCARNGSTAARSAHQPRRNACRAPGSNVLGSGRGMMGSGRRGDVRAASVSSRPPARLQVLIVHEQHPQPLGCDRRLLALAQLLQEQGHVVSLLYRHDVPEAEQSPKTAALAAMLGVQAFSPSDLSSCLHPPPALYRYDGTGQLEQLASRGWFDLVMVTVWFWNDPEPSFAEIALPVLRGWAPPVHPAAGRPSQPFVALLVDDAHALRAARLAREENWEEARAAYAAQAVTLPRRLASLYRMADLVAHVSGTDQAEERAAYPNVPRWQLLRTPLHAMAVLPGGQVPRPRSHSQTAHLGFVGNGQTATNHQAVQWFLQNCWPQLRRARPALRLRLVGRRPGAIINSSGVFDCGGSTGSAVRCGWAWGTPYEGRERESGIDEVGFVPSAAMTAEVLSWRAMVAPIRATTGINTKLLLALELGVPLVVTSAAAEPLELKQLTSDGTPSAHVGRHPTVARVAAARPAAAQPSAPQASGRRTAEVLPVGRAPAAALIADSQEEIVRAILRLDATPELWRRTAAAARDTFSRMIREDPAAGDVRALAAAVCAAHASPTPPGVPLELGGDTDEGEGDD